MKKILIDYDMVGYAYDPTRPTEQAERLCYKLNQIIDEIKEQGAEIRLVESVDITDAEAYVKGLYDAMITPPEETPELETPVNADMLSETGIYNALSLARSAWCKVIKDAAAGIDSDESLNAIKTAVEAMLNKDSIVYLSDGTPIFGETGLIGG